MRDAWLLQAALDRARARTRRRHDHVPFDAFRLAHLGNMTLPPRLQYTDAQMIDLMMRHAGKPIRVLLKETRTAWARAG